MTGMLDIPVIVHSGEIKLVCLVLGSVSELNGGGCGSQTNSLVTEQFESKNTNVKPR